MRLNFEFGAFRGYDTLPRKIFNAAVKNFEKYVC